MGLRSWITIVSSREQLQETIDFAKNRAYSISYVLQITTENAPFPKGTVIVAWSGDGDKSREELINVVDIYWDDVILLEDFLDDNPSADWHGGENGPGKYGVFLTEEQCTTVEIFHVPISFCADCMYNELFNKSFSTTTPVYAIVDTWHKEKIDDDFDCMCICIPPVFPDTKEYDIVTINSEWNGEELEFCYNFNIDALYSDDENKQEWLVNKFEKALMSNKKQLEGILRLDDWLKYYPVKPDNHKKTGIRVSFGEFEDKLWFCLTTPSIDIEDLSNSIRVVDLLNNWRKTKDIVEKVLAKIEAKL